jgi:hypothetical protein
MMLQGIYHDVNIISDSLRKGTNFENHITNKVQGKTCEVLIPRHPQVLRQSLNACIGNYAANMSISQHNRDRQYAPLLRSKNESKYKIETAGKSLRSSFLKRLFSLTTPLSAYSMSDSEFVEAPGRSGFDSVFSSAAMVPEFWTGKARRRGIKYEAYEGL